MLTKNPIDNLLEDYSSNKTKYVDAAYFKFLKKIFKEAKSSGALNVSLIYYTLNNNNPKNMDEEFMKTYLNSLTPENTTLVTMFCDYWIENMGMPLMEGMPASFNMIIEEEEVFAALVANNPIEKILILLSITANRISSITGKMSEDLFYSKCLSDYERTEFENTAAGLQFFGFGIKYGSKLVYTNSKEFLKGCDMVEPLWAALGAEEMVIKDLASLEGDINILSENYKVGSKKSDRLVKISPDKHIMDDKKFGKLMDYYDKTYEYNKKGIEKYYKDTNLKNRANSANESIYKTFKKIAETIRKNTVDMSEEKSAS